MMGLCDRAVGAAWRIGQNRMLHDVLMDGLDQRIVAHGLHKNGAVVVARRGRHVDLQRQGEILLEQLVMDVLDAFEPGHARIVNMVGFVVENGKLVDLANDLTQVGVAVGGLADGLWAERGQEVVAQIVIFKRGLADFAKIDAMDVGEEDVPRWPDDANVVLDMKCNLEIVPPVRRRGRYRAVRDR